MSSRLIVDSSNQLRESIEPVTTQPGALRVIAKIISFLFHPIFVPVYIVLFLLYVHPAVFAGFSAWKKTLVLLQAVGMYGFFPLVTVLLLRALGFVKSVYLHTQRDRIIPYTACMIWYFWIWYVWKNLPDSPRELVILGLAIFLASIIGMMANIYMKISMHTIAMGVMLSFIVLLALKHPDGLGLYLALAFLVAGLVCTARFIASNHSAKEIYVGLFSGVLVTLIAIWFTW